MIDEGKGILGKYMVSGISSPIARHNLRGLLRLPGESAVSPPLLVVVVMTEVVTTGVLVVFVVT